MIIWSRALLSALLLLSSAAGPPPTSTAPAALDTYVQKQLEATGVPGAAYAVIGAEGPQHTAVFGEDGDGEPITAQTPFLWGSVSKPVTATLVVLLARDGLLDLEDPVVQHVPSFPDPSTTIRQLLDHTSGLPRGLELTDHYGPGRSATQIVGALDQQSFGERKHSYSSLNYVVLAAVAESVTGQSFGRALQQRLLAPAGMHSVPADPEQAERALPPGHRYVLGSVRPFDSRVDAATQAAGYLTGSLGDLAAFASTQLPGGPVLTDSERDLLHAEQVDDYALGWRTTTVPGTDEPMVWHGGAAPGFQAGVLLLPQRNQAVVLLQNAYSPFRDAQLMDTSMGIASLLAGAEPQVHGPDPLYRVLLAVLSVLALVLGAVIVRLLLRRNHPRSRSMIWSGAAVTTLAVGLLALPGQLGVTRSQVFLWAPDVSVLLHLCLGLLAVVAVLSITLRWRTWRTTVRRPT
ncbi:beta-lactamase family protein [Kineosporia rhizophila]|uniref:serine hydrolase domain-containing protein n=1 Tax=Kineosporia rhizophila TaxID=84633 RepID=UPI001E5733A2|nr:serine hydrolase domain-containing protein [Kineosporia rhizophila]MCE0538215.1 beta-lactamase family protein [Kineosporia rhizophila]